MPKPLGTALAMHLQCWSFPCSGLTSLPASLFSPAWMLLHACCLPAVGKTPGFSPLLEMLLMPQEGARVRVYLCRVLWFQATLSWDLKSLRSRRSRKVTEGGKGITVPSLYCQGLKYFGIWPSLLVRLPVNEAEDVSACGTQELHLLFCETVV